MYFLKIMISRQNFPDFAHDFDNPPSSDQHFCKFLRLLEMSMFPIFFRSVWISWARQSVKSSMIYEGSQK